MNMNMSSSGSGSGGMSGSMNGFMNPSMCFKKFNRNYGSGTGIDFMGGQRRSGINNLL